MALALLAVAWLLTYLLHSTILLGGGWLLTAAGVVRSPGAKDTLWKVCLVGGLLTATVQAVSADRLYGRHIWLPSATAAAAPAAVPAPSSASVAASGGSPASASLAALPRHRTSSLIARRASVAGGATAVAVDRTPDAGHLTPVLTWPVLLLGLWLTGAVLLLARLAYRRVRFVRGVGDRREITGGAPVEMLDALRAAAGVRRRVRLVASASLTGPVAMGTSEICLPERALASLGPAEQRAVLAHELGHLVRRDPSWLALAVLVESVFFLQPLNRLARRRLQEAAEYLCDDWAARQTGGGLTLAKCLAEVAGWIQARGAVPVSGMAENRSQLVARVHRLLDGVEPRAARGLRYGVPVAALALSTVAFTAPGVLPPCPETKDAPAAAAYGVRVAAIPGGPTRPWATIRDGRFVTFRAGFAPRITGRGRIGIRRGGSAIELMDDQQLTLNGRAVADDEDVQVRVGDTLRIVDEGGATVWSLEPVQVPGDDGDTVSDAAGENMEPALSAAAAAADTGWTASGDVDDAALAADARDIARLGDRLGRDIQARIAPDVARIQAASVKLAVADAPRLAELGTRIAADVGAALAEAFGDSAACDSACPRHGRLRRGIDGAKRLR